MNKTDTGNARGRTSKRIGYNVIDFRCLMLLKIRNVRHKIKTLYMKQCYQLFRAATGYFLRRYRHTGIPRGRVRPEDNRDSSYVQREGDGERKTHTRGGSEKERKKERKTEKEKRERQRAGETERRRERAGANTKPRQGAGTKMSVAAPRAGGGVTRRPKNISSLSTLFSAQQCNKNIPGKRQRDRTWRDTAMTRGPRQSRSGRPG